MSYQGHLPDGSSVQRHSAGALYPFVLFARETAVGLRWGVITPHGHDLPALWSYEGAARIAEKMKAASLHHKPRTKVPSYLEPEVPYRARHCNCDLAFDDGFVEAMPFEPSRGTLDASYCLDAPTRLPFGGAGSISVGWPRRDRWKA